MDKLTFKNNFRDRSGFTAVEWIVTVAIIIVVIGGAIALYVHSKHAAPAAAPASSQTSSTTVGSTASAGGASSVTGVTGITSTPLPPSGTSSTTWVTYTNNKYGFSIQYPSYEKIAGNVTNGAVEFESSAGQNIYMYPTFTTANGSIAMYGGVALLPNASASSKTQNLNGYAWQTDSSGGGYAMIDSIRTGGIAVGLGITNSSQAAVMQQMIATFKLIQLPYERLDKVVAALGTGQYFGQFKVSGVSAGKASDLISGDNAAVTFTGPVNLSGSFDMNGTLDGQPAVCISLDAKSVAMLPQLDKSADYSKVPFCSTDEQTRGILSNLGGGMGTNITFTVSAMTQTLTPEGPFLNATISSAQLAN